jgi:hypothetical protein
MENQLKELYTRLKVLEAEKTQQKHIEPLLRQIAQLEEKVKNAN